MQTHESSRKAIFLTCTPKVVLCIFQQPPSFPAPCQETQQPLLCLFQCFPVCLTFLAKRMGGKTAVHSKVPHSPAQWSPRLANRVLRGAGFRFECCPLLKPTSYLDTNKSWLRFPGSARHRGVRGPRRSPVTSSAFCQNG